MQRRCWSGTASLTGACVGGLPPCPPHNVRVQVSDVKRAMELGKHAADFVSTTFVRPVKLEFEKVRKIQVAARASRSTAQLRTSNRPRAEQRNTRAATGQDARPAMLSAYQAPVPAGAGV